MSRKTFWLWIGVFGLGLWPADVSAQESLWEKYVSDAQKVQEQGLHDLAVGIYQLALKEAERFGEQDPRLAETLNSLASLYYEQGKYSQAESLYRRSLGLVEEVWGEGHPNVAVSLENIALLYLVQGRYSEAEPLFQRSLTIREKVMGAEHPTVAETLNKLALVYHRQERYSEAEPFQIDWHIDNYLPIVISFIEEWVATRDDESTGVAVHFMTFEEFRTDPDAYFESFLDFYGIDHELFAPDAEAEVIHLRKGALDEWREFFTAEQADRAWSLIPAALADEFCWQP